jgi:alpha-beta hydrolase superfamily lysophospholipase
MTDLTPREEFLTAVDRARVFVRHWPVTNPKGVLVICHGLGEYGGRYGNFVEALVPAGYALFAHDHRGHGKTDGRRGHVDRFDRFLDDLFLVVRHAATLYPGRPIFLFGHSMGGLIVLSYALRHPNTVRGVIASGAALKLQLEVPKLKALAGKLMAAAWPTFTMGNELDPHWLSHDEAVVQAYIDDPLVHDRVSARFYVEFTGAMERALFGAGALQMPLLAFHGGADPITSPEGTRLFYETASSADKTFRLFDGQFHEVHNDTAKAEAIGLVRQWLDRQAAN